MSDTEAPDAATKDGLLATPVRETTLPYGRQSVDNEDIAAVVAALRSDWLTTGPRVVEFERAFADHLGAAEAVAVSSGTAALHCAMFALGIGPGDEVIIPAMTFAASANCVLYQGGTPVFADVDPDTLLLDPAEVARRITSRTKAVISVDYAGHPCDYDRLRQLTDDAGIHLVDDACHALGGHYRGRAVGRLADLNTFSLHPVKHITTGEGGMITTDDPALAARMRLFRNHGISSDRRERELSGVWFHEMIDLGYNYRLSDVQCALGTSQLRKLAPSVARRQAIARYYDAAFADIPAILPLAVRDDVSHAYHLYVVRLRLDLLSTDRDEFLRELRRQGIGGNVHYFPVHLHRFYRERLGTRRGDCPVAETAYESIISLPIFPGMSEADARDVVAACEKLTRAFAR